MKSIKIIITLLFALFLAGCNSMTAINHIPKASNEQPMNLVVFLDGTANDEGSHTNIAKLHNLVTLQDNQNIRASYIKGVGTDGKIIGMAMGWGIGHDVREAYLFLAENYNYKRGDKIYLFGFSRGAYAARILAALVHVAGIPDVSEIEKNQRYDFVKKIYKANKGKKSIAERKDDIAAVLGYAPISRDIEFLGIWDTVEALGVPDYEENWKLPNSRYEDQLCNIKNAAHAVSIDDNRARIFTPVLLTNNHLIDTCRDVVINNIVDEVWFSGAHADVGGGYLNAHISGVSLNWMLKKIAKYNLVHNNTKVYSDYLGKTHDPESGIWGLIYRKRSRDLYLYAKHNNYNNNKLKVHQSVIDRLQLMMPKEHEYQWITNGFKDCFVVQGKGLKYVKAKDCFTVVGY